MTSWHQPHGIVNLSKQHTIITGFEEQARLFCYVNHKNEMLYVLQYATQMSKPLQ